MSTLGIIGAGPGGYVAAVYAAKKGLEVTIFERSELGGECTNWGCIPTKALYSYSHLYHKIEKAIKRKIFSEMPDHDYRKVVNRKDGVVKRSRMGIKHLFKSNNIQHIDVEARVLADGTVEADGENYTFDHVIIATGSDPAIPPVPGLEGISPLTNREALDLKEAPEKLLIIGAGVIGIEFAGIFNTFGSDVTVVEIMPTILTGFDNCLIENLHRTMAKQGIRILTDTGLDKIERSAEGVVAHIKGERHVYDEVIVAAGRRPRLWDNPEGLELDKRGHIVVDKYMKTSIDNVYAVGDVTGTPYLAHRASAMGEMAVDNILGEKREEPRHYPSGIFGAIELGTIGMTEKQVEEKFGEVRTGEFPYIASGRAQAEDAPEGSVKFVACPKGIIRGVHIAGEAASELVATVTKPFYEGMRISDFTETIIAHPTLSEMLIEAALDTENRAIHK